MKVTRSVSSDDLNPGKFAALEEQAKRLGVLRSEVWQRFGSLAGVGVSDRGVRDQWIKEERAFGVSANAWKETLRDAMADIKANREAAKVKLRQAIRRHAQDEPEQQRLYLLLWRDEWPSDPYLTRGMRTYWHRGHNHTHHQIIVRSDNYTVFELGGKAWIKIPGLERGKRIAIPLSTTVQPAGTLRIILRDGQVEVHYAVDVEPAHDCGGAILGVDKGYSEVLVDSEGEHHGDGLGELLANESDYLKTKYRRRSKLRAIAQNTPSQRKRQNIERNNLGRKKLNRRARRTKSNIRTMVFNAVHAVVDKASTIAAEDLTAPMSGKPFGKNVNRRLSSWTKGVIAEALATVSQRRGSTLVLVNASYTSQMDSRYGVLLGRRSGDSFYCFDGVVLQADQNAARNVRARLFDPEIDRWTPYQLVKSILLERTKRRRLGLLNLDSSCEGFPSSTESEAPNGQLCPIF